MTPIGTATPSRFLTRDPDGPHDAAVPLRLFCFHHAGGAASTFAGWQRALGPSVSVLPVQLPGREGRAREPRARDLTELVAALDADLGPRLDRRPYAFYGHSMGALVAHALTRSRFERGRDLPERLVVGACPAPHLRTPLDAAADRSDQELSDFLIDIGGMSPTVLRYPEWRSAATALLRDDLRLCASDPYRDRPPPGTGSGVGAGTGVGVGVGVAPFAPLPCPIEVFVGDADPLVPVHRAAAWRAYTSAGCRVHVSAGGHFFAQGPGTAFPRRLLAALRHAPSGARGC